MTARARSAIFGNVLLVLGHELRCSGGDHKELYEDRTVAIGIFLIVAAVQHDVSKAKGLDGVLLELAHQSFGQVLLGVVAIGLFAYGIYSLVEARYRRIGTS